MSPILEGVPGELTDSLMKEVSDFCQKQAAGVYRGLKHVIVSCGILRSDKFDGIEKDKSNVMSDNTMHVFQGICCGDGIGRENFDKNSREPMVDDRQSGLFDGIA